MTDQIYYKVQYPIKKAINIIKEVDPEVPFGDKDIEELTSAEIETIEDFIENWENSGRKELKNLIKRLRQIQ
ncbi:hypothetical protein [Halothermothrix orenii]|uniref:Uncharacterized protein n=1 Tax=Halothermothrix orenii (strain H 168 / OCM 544 / DSM 9562) TaxID=373903 RepID=B8CXG7_HALOH|nr:hypothetical protein [Halothermothrix orenii]ACL69986.1 hypothetical protein Hore_12360 [Halothermothrix orenii H 168]